MQKQFYYQKLFCSDLLLLTKNKKKSSTRFLLSFFGEFSLPGFQRIHYWTPHGSKNFENSQRQSKIQVNVSGFRHFSWHAPLPGINIYLRRIVPKEILFPFYPILHLHIHCFFYLFSFHPFFFFSFYISLLIIFSFEMLYLMAFCQKGRLKDTHISASNLCSYPHSHRVAKQVSGLFGRSR